MNWIDVLVVISTLAIALVSYRYGIILMTFTLAGFIGGIVLAARYHAFLGESNLAQVAAFAIVLVGVWVVASVVGRGVRSLFRVVQLGWIDRAGAAVLGVVVGLAICAGVLAVVAKTTTFGVGDVPVGDQEVHEAVVVSQDWASENISESCLARLLLERSMPVRSILPGEFDFLEHFFR